jgi:ribosomal protein S2
VKAQLMSVSSRDTSQQAVLKFAAATGATPTAGHFTLENLTNQIQLAFQKLHLLVDKITFQSTILKLFVYTVKKNETLPLPHKTHKTQSQVN